MKTATFQKACWAVWAVEGVIVMHSARLNARNASRGSATKAARPFSFARLPKRERELLTTLVTDKMRLGRIHDATCLAEVKAIGAELTHRMSLLLLRNPYGTQGVVTGTDPIDKPVRNKRKAVGK